MLNAAGLVRKWSTSVCCFPTLRGRFLLDFTRRLLLDVATGTEWSAHTMRLFYALGVDTPEFPTDATSCGSHYGRNLLAGILFTPP